MHTSHLLFTHSPTTFLSPQHLSLRNSFSSRPCSNIFHTLQQLIALICRMKQARKCPSSVKRENYRPSGDLSSNIGSDLNQDTSEQQSNQLKIFGKPLVLS